MGVAVFAERVAKGDIGRVLTLDQHVSLANDVGLGVELLAKDRQPCLRVVIDQELARHATYPVDTGCGS